MYSVWKLSVLVLVMCQLMQGIQGECPKRCMCRKRHVSCMHLGLEAIPHVPSDTIVLDLRFNKIRDIPKGSFSNLRDLTTLLLNNNLLTVLRDKAFDGLPNLVFLYLYKNRIHHIDDGAFDGLGNMKQLYLHFNNIETFSNAVFPDLPSLERLFLQNNRIKRIPPGAFDDLPTLRRLRLDSNALICDCSITWFMKLLNDSNFDGTYLQAAATCNAPDNMKGLSIVNMDKNDLHCEEPTIHDGPKDLTITFGGRAVFTCRATGDPLPEIKWIKNSYEISYYDPKYRILDDGTLMIDHSGADDEGVFECIAKNPLGEKKSNIAKMTITNKPTEGLPKFTKVPHSELLKVGQTTHELYCQAKGSPHPHISWYHNDKKMSLSSKVKIVNGGNLLLSDIDEHVGGEYKCEAENIHGKIHAIAQLRFLVPPNGVITKEPPVYKYGQELTVRCSMNGFPSPVITWYKDGVILQPSTKINIDTNHIILKALDESDSGTYLCRAENSEGFKEFSTDIAVKKYTNTSPRLVYKPYDIETFQGSKIELPCKSDSNPKPIIVWNKDGTNLFKTERHKISQGGSLYIINVTQQDSGRYECTAVNEYGRATASGFVTIIAESLNRPGDKFVKIAFAEATREVDLAINNTVNSLFGNNTSRPNMGDLYRIIRYPNAADRELARAGEVYERTLVNIRRHVNEGKSVNITSDFSYRELLSTDHLNLVAKLSGCITHRHTTNCTNMCFHSKYRSIDGTCNNLNNPTWGASNTGFRRILKPIYENGFSLPVGWTKLRKYNNFELPSARLVSTKLISTKEVTPDSRISHMVMQWGQFLDHDLDHATPSVSSQSWDGIDCKRSCDYAAPCFPIDVPKGDSRIGNRRCMDFIRSSSVCGSGMTSVFFDEIQPREQINQLTSYIDASQVYGYAEHVAQDLRNLTSNDGLLRTGVTFPGKKALLPYSSGLDEMDCRRGALEDNIKCFAAGDIRANEQVGLLAMHTMWFREHNRISTQLKKLNPHWNGDNLYHEARKIVGAEMQHITYNHWLPIILGPVGMEKLGTFKGYDSLKNPTISNVFATAALRFGHSLINPVLQRLDNNFNEIPEGHLPLHKAFFASWRLVEEGGVDPLLRGLFTVPAKLKTPGQNLNSELTEKLFHVAHAVALDLAAMNIQRSRDHAVPAYAEWRKYCNMSEIHTFDDLKKEISNAEVRHKLKELYGSVYNIDVWVGGILEDQVDGGKVGPLFRCLLVDQFQRLRDGDRFWYENPTVFKQEQLTQIKQVSLARILCDNGDNIDKVTDNLFILPEAQGGFTECDHLPKVDLRMWADCSDCEDGFCSSVSPHGTRNRRSLESLIVEAKRIRKTNSQTAEEYHDTLNSYRAIIKELEAGIKEHREYINKLDVDCKTKCEEDRQEELKKKFQTNYIGN